MTSDSDTTAALAPYVPRVIREWLDDDPTVTHRQLASTFVFIDISGFTPMSERLARLGRAGAEELTVILNACFSRLLDDAYALGGSLVKFGGDALLLLFQGDDHRRRGAAAALDMRRSLREIGRVETPVGKVTLRMSVAVHGGPFDFFLVGEPDRELLICGQSISELTSLESAASAGRILVDESVAAALPAHNRGDTTDLGTYLRGRVAGVDRTDLKLYETTHDLTPYVAPSIRDRVLASDFEPEHRMATVGFLHLTGVDSLLEFSGPELAAKAIDEVVVGIQRAATDYEVAVLNSDITKDGIKVILTAGVPVSTGQDEEQMLLALRQIVDADLPLPLKIGVNRGRVFAGEIGTQYRRTYTVMGDAVNLAARLMTKAEPGQIVSTGDVLAGSRTLFETTELEPFFVKGKKAPIVADVVGVPRGSRAQITEAGLPLIGRDAELGEMLVAWDSARAGKGRVVDLIGEPGIGKTRLLDEFLGQVGDEGLIRSECRLYQSTTPYFPFRSLMRHALGLGDLGDEAAIERLEEIVVRHTPDLAPWLSLIGVALNLDIDESEEVSLLEDEFRKTRLEETVDALLAAVLNTPTVLTIEDTHWMDEASRDLVTRLTSGIDQLPWLICVTRRPAEGPEPEDESVTAIELQPLSVKKAAELITAATEDAPLMPQQVDSLAEKAEGNPLFLIELLSAMQLEGDLESLPESVEGLINARIDRLPADDRTMLRHISVLGTGFEAPHVETVLPNLAGDGKHALTRLADFLAGDPGGWVQFRHALIRDVAYEGLPYRTRQRLHAGVADSILTVSGDHPEEQAELLSLHYFEAKQWSEAWNYSRIAGDSAKVIYANLDAAQFYERALEAARQLASVTDQERANVWVTLGDVREIAGLFEDSADAYRRASSLVGDDHLAQASLSYKRARARMRAGSYRTALSETTKGSRLAESLDTSEGLTTKARLTALRALIRQAQQRASDALTLAEQAAGEAEEAGDDEAMARSYMILDWANRRLGQPDRAGHASKALTIYEELGDLDAAGDVLNNLGADAYVEGEWDEAVDLYAKGRDAHERAGNGVGAAVAGTNIGELLISQNRLEEARSILEDAIRVLRAAKALDDGLFAEIQLGRLLVEQGDYEEADKQLNDLRSEALGLGQSGYALEAAMHLADSKVAQGDGAGALHLLDEAEEAAGGEDLLYAPTLERVRAQALADEGRFEEAEEQLQLGLNEARRQGVTYEEALLLLVQAEVARQSGRDAKAADPERADRILQRLGVRR